MSFIRPPRTQQDLSRPLSSYHSFSDKIGLSAKKAAAVALAALIIAVGAYIIFFVFTHPIVLGSLTGCLLLVGAVTWYRSHDFNIARCNKSVPCKIKLRSDADL